ncbi:unnamed protein product [Cylicocyclus nassatus]|uniref:Uncharacterized protein n=1 Tax=Cylicocyclus nassatus TaxID=53992 RepID=A0AA36M5A4_CYLNA|nr:unnamed protein product [Cylicocyclus nassatus]
MASSRGRERLKERQTNGRQFVFGSSTPRDLSHMNKIPPKFRSYDAKVRVTREGPGLREYMQKARSLTREGSTETRHWAFGSSTPRDLAHMTAISTAQRVYDAKSPKKSTTSPEFVTPVHKRSTTAPQPIQRLPPKPLPKRHDEDASSEPDFVQDREEFIADLRKKKAAEAQKKEKQENKMNGKVNAKEQTKAKDAGGKAKMNEPPPYAHATELASEIRSTERVPQNVHEDTSAVAHESSVKGLKDQIVVSELLEASPDKEIVVDKSGTEIGKNVESKSSEITKKVLSGSKDISQDLVDLAKDLKTQSEAKVDSVLKEVGKTVDTVTDKLEGVAKKVDETQADAADLASRLGSSLTNTLSKAAEVVEKSQELLGNKEKPHEEQKKVTA